MATAAAPRPLSSGSRALAPLPGTVLSKASSPSDSGMSPTTPVSLTAKQWVIPPRPKPGRKPATDTPPTKRKAQNRAAQRAFRERRAAKVGELEEQMEELEKEHDSVVDGLRYEIDQLHQSFDTRMQESLGNHENQIRLLQAEVGGWRAHCIQLEEQTKAERKCRLSLESELAVLKGQAVKLPRRSHPPSNSQPYRQPPSSNVSSESHRTSTVARDDRVTLAASIHEDHSFQVKRTGTPPAEEANPNKRQKRDIINRTSPAPEFGDVSSDAISATLVRPAESCGFCQDGSTCPCAELAAEQERSALEDNGSRLPSPPRELSEKPLKPASTAAQPTTSGCKNNPGTCTQCKSDPGSRRFCRSLADARTAASAPLPLPSPHEILPVQDPMPPINTIVPCAAGQACCRISSALSSTTNNPAELDFTTPATRANSSSIYATSQAVSGPTLSCADAFTTLAKHPKFSEASKDYGEWLPQLATVPGDRAAAAAAAMAAAKEKAEQSGISTPTSTHTPSTTEPAALGQVPARTAFDIEAASVMGVLRFFDRRFGRDT